MAKSGTPVAYDAKTPPKEKMIQYVCTAFADQLEQRNVGNLGNWCKHGSKGEHSNLRNNGNPGNVSNQSGHKLAKVSM